MIRPARGMIRPSRGKMIGEKFQSKMGKSAIKLTISIDRHRKIQHFDGYCYKMRKVSPKKNDLQKIENKFRPKISGGKSQSSPRNSKWGNQQPRKNDLQKIENKFVGLAGRYPKTSR